MTNNEIIKALKNNTSAFGLMSEELREAAREIATKKGNNFELYSCGYWRIVPCVSFNIPDKAYRLRPDYQPEPEFEKFEIVVTDKNIVNPELGFKWGEIEFYLCHIFGKANFSHFETDKGNKIGIEDIATYIAPKDKGGQGGKVYVVLRKE